MSTIYGLMLPRKARPFVVEGALGDTVITSSRGDGKWCRHYFEDARGRDHERLWLPFDRDAYEKDERTDIVRIMRETEAGAAPMPNPDQDNCGHMLEWARDHNALVCRICPLEVSGLVLRHLNVQRPERTKDGVLLADELQRVSDENTQLLAENARLRRALEKASR